ncbi:MAG: hypothetical protein JWM68_2528 [Verrucomicrobiales bacterium]|nr:hypothetical protein [Verrucomicrobiales bacterium]
MLSPLHPRTVSTFITNVCTGCSEDVSCKAVECKVFWAGYPSWLYKDYPHGYGSAAGGGRWLVATIRIENLLNGAWLESVYTRDQWDDTETVTSSGSGDTDYGMIAGQPGYVGAVAFVDTALTDTVWSTDMVSYYDHSVVYRHEIRTLSVDNGIDVWRPQLESVVDSFDFSTLSAFQAHYFRYDASGLVDDGVITSGIGCYIQAGFTFDNSFGPYLNLSKRKVTVTNTAFCLVNEHRDKADDYQTFWDGTSFAAPDVDLIDVKKGCHAVDPITVEAYADKLGPTTLFVSSCIYCDSCAAYWPTLCNPAP